MKVFRFMSNEEFERFNRGEKLLNYNKHWKENKTDSEGFCFFDLEDFKPEDAMHFLTGIVPLDICAVFEVDESYLNKSCGRYAKPFQGLTGDPLVDLLKAIMGQTESFDAKEYCTTENFNNENFKLVKYTKECYKSWNSEGKENFNWEDVK